MKIIEKIKLLFKIRKPAGQLADQVKGIKRGWKKVSFWVSFLGTLLSVVAALSGVLTPYISLIINTTLTLFYNILRGLDKADEVGIRPIVQTTEFWQGAMGEASNAIVALHTGGIDPAWLHTAEMLIAMGMAAAQNLAAQQPEKLPETKATPS